jgi:hypothetical protein
VRPAAPADAGRRPPAGRARAGTVAALARRLILERPIRQY